MPNSGSQIAICDLPVRFDTYEGCSHQCSYCFVMRKYDVSKIKKGESVVSLQNFIKGQRTNNLKWCDWNIPIHWGGMSDPFQPIEIVLRRSLECLKVFADTQYPFVVSTKNKLISEGEYFDLITKCNCVVQFSAACPSYDKFERGASTFEERIKAAEKIAKHKRVIIRVQPYIPQYLDEILGALPMMAAAGVYGCVFEAMKYQYKAKGTKKLRGDFVFPTDLLKVHFGKLKTQCHKLGMKFYCGENRLRSMGDNLCCCGIDGMGWRPNTANLNHILFDGGGEFTRAMYQAGTANAFKATHQNSLSAALNNMSYFDMMQLIKKDKVIYCNYCLMNTLLNIQIRQTDNLQIRPR